MFDFSKMSIEDMETRKAAIAVELDNDGADLDALEAETRAINEEIEKRKADATKRANIRAAVAGSAVQGRKVDDAEKSVPTLD